MLTNPIRNRILRWLLATASLTACQRIIGADFDGAHLASGGAGENAGSQLGAGGNSAGDGTSAQGGRSVMGSGGRTPAAGEGGREPSSSGGSGALVLGGAAGDGGAAGAAGGDTSCALSWRSIDVRLPSGAVPVRNQAQGVLSLLGDHGQPICTGAQLARDQALFLGCPAVVEYTVAGLRMLDALEERLKPTYHRVVDIEQTAGYSLVHFDADAADINLPLAWSTRAPVAGESAALVRVGADGIGTVADLTLGPSLFDNVVHSPKTPLDWGALFGIDGRFIGFCAVDRLCAGAPACVSAGYFAGKTPGQIPAGNGADIAAKLRTWAAMSGVFWGDVDGSGTPDAIIVNRDGIAVRTNDASLNDTAIEWWCPDCSGEVANLFADVTGDGAADFVAVGPGVVVSESSGGQGFPIYWEVETDVSGAEEARIADVDGDGEPDLVVLDSDERLWVTFGLDGEHTKRELWRDGVPGGWLSFDVVEVTGEQSGAQARADIVFGYRDHVEVLASTGASFAEPTTWLSEVDVLPPGWFFTDVTGDGRADAVGIDRRKTSVYVSDDTRFSAAEKPWGQVPVGERCNRFADLNGDGRADATVHDIWGIRGFFSSGNELGAVVDVDTDYSFFGGY